MTINAATAMALFGHSFKWREISRPSMLIALLALPDMREGAEESIIFNVGRSAVRIFRIGSVAHLVDFTNRRPA